MYWYGSVCVCVKVVIGERGRGVDMTESEKGKRKGIERREGKVERERNVTSEN